MVRFARLVPLTLLLTTALVNLGGEASAATCTVPTGAYPTINSAVMDGSCTTIKLRPGTITESGISIPRSLAITGAGIHRTTVDGGGSQVFQTSGAGPIEISNMTIRNGNGSGAAVSSFAPTVLRRVYVTQNNGFNGTITVEAGSLEVVESTISANVAGAQSGGVHVRGTANAVIRRSTVDHNQATQEGGGISAVDTSSLTIEDSTISGNSSQDSGGGINIEDSANLTVRRSTIANNIADANNNGSGDGGGLYMDGPFPTMQGSILANNLDRGGEGPECDGSGNLSSQGGNLIRTLAGCGISGSATDRIGGPGSEIDPLLLPLGNYGGPTLTRALDRRSPARNLAGACGGPTDQRGAPRGNRCDSGAYDLVFCRGITVNRVGTAGNDLLVGTSGRDGIIGLGGKDRLRGRGGRDGLCGGGGRDRLSGGGGADRLSGGGKTDRLFGGAGDDRLNGGRGTDLCDGGAGSNTFTKCEQ